MKLLAAFEEFGLSDCRTRISRLYNMPKNENCRTRLSRMDGFLVVQFRFGNLTIVITDAQGSSEEKPDSQHNILTQVRNQVNGVYQFGCRGPNPVSRQKEEVANNLVFDYLPIVICVIYCNILLF